MGETKVIYYVDEEQTPYLIKLPVPSDKVTLGDFKNAVPVISRPGYKYFFKSVDDDFGVVKEEVIEDSQHLPVFNNRVVSWVATTESSDTGSQVSADVYPTTERAAGIGDSRPPSFHANRRSDDSTEAESSHNVPRQVAHRHRKENRPNVSRSKPGYEASSMLSSDLDTTSFIDSDDDSRLSTTTDQSKAARRERRKRRKHRVIPMSRASSFSSITDSSMSLNIITVVLSLDTVNFLGISIVGQSNKGGDGGIYVGSIMKGGAVAQDGRIEPGDMILEVNKISFENMSNDDAVRALREAVQKPGPITLVVAKCWDPNPKSSDPKGFFTVPRQEPVRPIDPSAWVAHTEAVAAGYNQGTVGYNQGTATASSSGSSSITSNSDLNLSKTSDVDAVVKAMTHPDSGLEIRDRMWLKITIPNAFIGSDLVDWLHHHVEGFSDRRDARKYAAQLLKMNFIRHTVNKVSFSEQCYYVFGDSTHGGLPAAPWLNQSNSSASTLVPNIPTNLSNLTLEDIDSVSEAAGHSKMPTWNSNPYGPSYPSTGPGYTTAPGGPGYNSSAPGGPPHTSHAPPHAGHVPPHVNMGQAYSPAYLPPQNYAPPPRYDALSYIGAESAHSGKRDQTCACIATHLGKQIKKLWENPEKGSHGATAGPGGAGPSKKFDVDINDSTSSESGSSVSNDSQQPDVQQRPLPSLPVSANPNAGIFEQRDSIQGIRSMGDV